MQSDPVVDSVREDGTMLARQTAQCAGITEVTLFEIRGGGQGIFCATPRVAR